MQEQNKKWNFNKAIEKEQNKSGAEKYNEENKKFNKEIQQQDPSNIRICKLDSKCLYSTQSEEKRNKIEKE